MSGKATILWRLLTVSAIRNYDGRVIRYANKLAEQLSTYESRPVNISKWLAFFSFDLMGDLAFGHSFNSLEEREFHWGTKLLRDSGKAHVVLGKLPWLIAIMARIPFISTEMLTFYAWCAEQAEKRKYAKIAERDISSYFLDAEPMSTDPSVNDMWLHEDAILVVSAGSDTTTEVMTHCFYHLAKDPLHIHRIRGELEPFGGRELSAKELSGLKYLNGFINENLRLHHPVPCGLLRMTPPEGLQVGDRHLPGNVTVCCPPWITGRCECLILLFQFNYF
jgi:cytochrome P450